MKINKENGFSLVEVLIAIGVMGIMMIGVAQLFIYSVWVNRYVQETTRLSSISQYVVDDIRKMYIDGIIMPPELVPNEAEFAAAYDANGLTVDDFKAMLDSRHAAAVLPGNIVIRGAEAKNAIDGGDTIAAWVYWFVENDYSGYKVTIHADTGFRHRLQQESTPLISKASISFTTIIPDKQFFAAT